MSPTSTPSLNGRCSPARLRAKSAPWITLRCARVHLDVKNVNEAQGAAQPIYRSGSVYQYVNLMGAAGQIAIQPHCMVKGASRPDGDIAAKMVANMLDTRQKSRTLSEGRNVFGFDVHFTPARSYESLWNEVKRAAEDAKMWQRGGMRKRQIASSISQTSLHTAITGVKADYDLRLAALTGCSSAPPERRYFILQLCQECRPHSPAVYRLMA